MKHVVLALLWLVPITSGAQYDPFADDTSLQAPAQEDDTFKVYPDAEGTEYFPDGTASYYTRYLSALKELSLRRELKGEEEFLFRFTYLRSFDDPLVVSVTRIGDTLKIRAAILEMSDDYRPDGIVHDENLTFDVDDAKDVLAKINSDEFWQPLNDAERFCEGLDGSRWIFEIHDETGYRMIAPWSPASNIVPDDVDLPKLLREAGLKEEKVRDYKVYVEVGYELLRMADILPDQELRY